MSGLLRKLRAVLGIGLTWGILWVAVAFSVGTIIGIVDPDSIDPGEEPIVLAPMIGLVGFICGLVFAVLLSIIERQKPILGLPLFQLAFWGFLVAGSFPILAGKDFSQMLLVGTLGALSALVSVAVARTTKHWRHQSA